MLRIFRHSVLLLLFWNLFAFGASSATTTSDLSTKSVDASEFVGVTAGILGGGAWPSGERAVNWNEGFVTEAQLGYQWAHWRLEEGFDFYRSKSDESITPHGTVDLSTIMTNAYYDFYLTHRVTFYLGTGMGLLVGWGSGSSTQLGFGSDNQEAFAYQGISGLGFWIGERIRLDVRYRCIDWTDSKDLYLNILEGGLSFIV